MTKHLMVVDADIDSPSWVPEYLEKVAALLAQYNGRYITRSAKIELLEGDKSPEYSLIAEFDTKESALEFYHSEEYATLKAMRQTGSTCRFLLLPIENSTS